MACQQPFGDLTGSENVTDPVNPVDAPLVQGFGGLAGWGLGSSSSLLYPPIFQTVPTPVNAAGAGVAAAAVKTAAVGQDSSTGGLRYSFGAFAAGNSSSITGNPTAAMAADLKLPSLDDILLLHHMQEQQRKQQRQQQLALLRSCFMQSYSTLSGSNKRTASSTSSNSTSTGCTRSGTRGGTFPATASMLPAAVGSTAGGTCSSTPAALLPLFKMPAPRTSYTGSIAGSTSTAATLVQDPAIFDQAGQSHRGSTAGSSHQRQQQQGPGQYSQYGQQQYSQKQQYSQQQQGGGSESILLAHKTLQQLLNSTARCAAADAGRQDERLHTELAAAAVQFNSAAASTTFTAAAAQVQAGAQADTRHHSHQVAAIAATPSMNRSPGTATAIKHKASNFSSSFQESQQQQQQQQKAAVASSPQRALDDVTSRTVNGGVRGSSPPGAKRHNLKNSLSPGKERATATEQQQQQQGMTAKQQAGLNISTNAVALAGASTLPGDGINKAAGAMRVGAGLLKLVGQHVPAPGAAPAVTAKPGNAAIAAAAVQAQPRTCRVTRAAAAAVCEAGGVSPMSDEWSAASGLMLLLQSCKN
jgi:hypothetical protein